MNRSIEISPPPGLEEVYAEYRTYFVRIAVSYVRDRMVAEDLVSDTFLKIWESRTETTPRNLPAYLLTALKRKCLDYLRDQAIHLRIQQNMHQTSARVVGERIARLEANDPQNLMMSEALAIIERELRRMPEQRRRIFIAHGEKQASRVIVETDRPVDAAISAYLDGKGYEAEGDRRDSGKAAYFLQLAAGGLGEVGLVFSVMSFYILMLSIFLLLQKNSAKLETLLLLGYAPGRVARPYWLLTLWLNLGVLVVAVVLSWLVRMWYLPELAALQEGYAPAGVGVTWVCGIGLALLLSLSNGIAIRRRIDTLNRKRS